MEKQKLIKLIDVAAGRKKADLVLKNAKIVDVFQAKILTGDIAISDGYIAGIGGSYQGVEECNYTGKYVAPGFIEAHIHIESSYVSPEEFSRVFIPRGTTTILADPHEIVNVAGLKGLDYMVNAAKNAKMDIRYMMPPCVPATNFETSGADLYADDMEDALKTGEVDGLAELMNFPGVINADDKMIDEILMAKKYGARIDGHAPQVVGKDLNAYIAAGPANDHECSTLEEAEERLARGMYLLLREGSVTQDLRKLLPIVNTANSRRCLLSGDDVQAKTAINKGHLDNSIRICIDEGLNPITAIQMATLNPAEYCGLNDRGAIAPGRRADMVVFESLEDFAVEETYILGEKLSQGNKYLGEVNYYPIDSVESSMHVKDFTREKLQLHLNSDKVRAIGVVPGEVLTTEEHVTVKRDGDGNFVYNDQEDVTKIVVVERHHNTGNVNVNLLSGYGIKAGAIAISIGHDSHNIIATGTNDDDIFMAVNELIKQEGGAVVVKDEKVISRMELKIAGLMCNLSAEKMIAQQDALDEAVHEELGVPDNVNPVMTLSFMTLAVIPKLKITDKGLVDVEKNAFVSNELD
ncbi:adenine deaminase [Ligilactobacillus salivarius]|uniref:Adenine deaminase n=1 Tax=Ligilactobacillus salivarius TaxID=1624 RepID=A0A1V9U037_9LACO|nr:adenine deaminase [Ligilactobacillus salivarius]EFK79269.1 adenine deaminase [Ligilactobacillus salivarius ACS-116-V-Col5a]OQR12079.1 adenine deaminase [Ligilactobacillus salivarius]OQR20967.1 adenine deaminase [Ligilactobacillus salivarius]OQR23278.1 adenine deaminase [Ligilactobacillus salivarius]OQR25363.1 adenine deaminase [Ligilactobacillus salivarius]